MRSETTAKELLACLISMDLSISRDILGETEGPVLDALRFYEKVLIHLLGLEEQASAYWDLDMAEVDGSCEAAYTHWLSHDPEREVEVAKERALAEEGNGNLVF